MLRIAICDDQPNELERADSLLKKYPVNTHNMK